MDNTILLLEDDLDLGATLEETLTFNGQKCQLFKSCTDVLKAIASQHFDLYILDVNLPDGNGIDIAVEILRSQPTAPIILLSAASDPILRLRGLEAGAFDFINKPFTLKELLIKIERIKKSIIHIQSSKQTLSFGKLKINFLKFEIYDAIGKTINMTHKECAILKLLMDNANNVVSRDQILDTVWGQDSFPSLRTIDNYIVNLRKWCDSDPDQPLHIVSVRGIGYKLSIKGSSP